MGDTEIKVGVPVTEIFYSDRHAYEITKVLGDKHFIMKRYDVVAKEPYSNNWEYTLKDGYEYEIMYRYNKWYKVQRITQEVLDRIMKEYGFLYGITEKEQQDVKNKGVAYRYDKANIRIGVKDEYYDYEF